MLVRKTAHDVDLGQLAQDHKRLDRSKYVPTILNSVTGTELAVIVNDVSVHLIYSVYGSFGKALMQTLKVVVKQKMLHFETTLNCPRIAHVFARLTSVTDMDVSNSANDGQFRVVR